ncbi:MAG: serine hydrolase domain-containing protein [Bacteroidota bacterium]
MIRKISACLLGALLANGIVAQGNFIKDSLDTYINREMKRWQLPGMALAIVKDGKVIVMKGYGYADMKNKKPVTENTVFQIASNTKAFTGTSLALLEHYQKISLNDKVKTFLPYFNMKEDWKTKEITIADVLSHRIGYETFQTDLVNWATTRTRKQLIENMVNVSPKFGLRETFGYCNLGYLIAGEIIPVATDTSWDNYIKYHYLLPLEMKQTSTTYEDFMDPAKTPTASKAYSLINDQVGEIVPANVNSLAPAAGISSSVNDLSHWVMMQLGNGIYNGKQVIPKEVIERTRESFFIDEPISRKGNNFNTYGLGWFLKDAYGKKVVTHDGGANGFLSKTVLIPEEHVGFVILTNSDAQYFYEALGKQLTDDLLAKPYTNYSTQYYAFFEKDHLEELQKIKEFKALAGKHKAEKDTYTKLSGTYTNEVYGKITVVGKDKFAEVSFEFHPQYKGTIRFMTDVDALIEYNDPTLGVHEIRIKDESIEIKVSDFIDMDTYLFTKISNHPFPVNK